MSHVALLETFAQSLLSAIASPDEALDVNRLIRDTWAVWGKESDPATRQADLITLAMRSREEVREEINEIVRRFLPGKAGPIHGAVTRYLTALPMLLHRLEPQGIDRAEDLLRNVPSRIPLFLPGDRPAGIGDYELVEVLRVTTHAEAWFAHNSELPDRPRSIFTFYLDRDEARRVLGWYRSLAGVEGFAKLEDTYLSAELPGLRFAPATSPRFEQRADLYRPIVETVARLHGRNPPVTVGRITRGDVFLHEGKPALLLLEPSTEESLREDVFSLGRLGTQYLPNAEGALADLFRACLADDPLQRPANAIELLGQLPKDASTTTTTPSEPATPIARTKSRRSGEVWKVLDSLQKTEPERAKLLTNAVGMRFVLIPAGKFFMGSPKEEMGRRENEGPTHEVILTRPFYLATTPTTQQQYERVIGVNPSRFQGAAGGGPDHPVECVSWDDAVAFCQRLNDLPAEREAGRLYRLPTEAEWEFACRASTTTPFHVGASLSSREANVDGNHPYGDGPREQTAPRTSKVGSFAANLFGLYDVHGNVWEWCQDWYDATYYQHSPRQDPTGPEKGIYRVLRGGSWRNQAATCRSAYRNAMAPNQRQPFLGFRVALVVE